MLSLPIPHRLCSLLSDDEQATAATAAGSAKRKLVLVLDEKEQWTPACAKHRSPEGGSASLKPTVSFFTIDGELPERTEKHECPVVAPMTKGSLQQRRRGVSLKIDCPAPEDNLQNFHTSGCSLLDQYDLGEQLGQGSAGFVRKAVRKTDKLQVAVKIMQAFDEEMISIRRQEFEVLRKLKHPNIVKAVDFFVAQDQAVLVLEYFNSRTLEDAIRLAPGRMLSEPIAKSLSSMLLQAVDCLHQNQIVHRDIKAANILVSPDLTQLRLIDFNSARCMLDGGALTMTGTTLYLAPEVLQGTSASESADVWSVGLCLHEMLAGNLPWQSRGCRSLAAYAKKIISSPLSSESKQWHRLSKECRAILQLCLQVDADLRPAPASLLQHAWFQTDVAGNRGGHAKEEACARPEKSTKSSWFKALTTRNLAKILPLA